jgi:Tfp pilus assembly protein PilF
VDIRARLEAMLAAGQDGAALRYALGSRCLEEGDAEQAVAHLEVALKFDGDYSAAWKLLGKARTAKGEEREAAETYRRGIAVANRRGDRQAAKEMTVFLKRLERASS